MGFDLRKELTDIARALDGAGIPYAVCGGLAVALHGCPRGTKDIDLIVQEDDVPRITGIVEGLGFNLPSGLIPFGVGTATERRLYRVSKARGEDLLTLDLMVVTPVYEDVWKGRETVPLPEGPIGIVSIAGLVKMKLLAGRHQDLSDVENLNRIRPS